MNSQPNDEQATQKLEQNLNKIMESIYAEEDAKCLRDLTDHASLPPYVPSAREEIQSIRYVAGKGLRCPGCDGTMLVSAQVRSQPDGGLACTVSCDDCETSWAEYWRLAGISHVQLGPSLPPADVATTPLERAVMAIQRLGLPPLPASRRFIADYAKSPRPTPERYEDLLTRCQQMHCQADLEADCLLRELFPTVHKQQLDMIKNIAWHLADRDELQVDEAAMLSVAHGDPMCESDPYADVTTQYRHTLSLAEITAFAEALQRDTGC